MKIFDVVRIIHVDNGYTTFFSCEVPTDEEYRKQMQKVFKYAGTIALCNSAGGLLNPILGKLPYSAWWDDPYDYQILGNIREGYVVDMQQLAKEYHEIQKMVAKDLSNIEWAFFDETSYADMLRTKILEHYEPQSTTSPST